MLDLINAVSQIKENYNLIIAGDAFSEYDKQYFNKIKNIISKKKLNNVIKKIGYKS